MNPAAVDASLFGRLFLYSLVASLVLSAVGAPFVAAVCERLAVTRKRVFYDKLGMQLATFGLICGLGTLPFPLGLWVMDWAGNWYALYIKHPDLPLPAFSVLLAGGASLLIAGCYAAALALLIAYKSTWKAMKKSKGPHAALGFLAALFGVLTLGVTLLHKRMVLRDATLEAAGIDALLQSASGAPVYSLLWPALLLAGVSAIAAAGGFGLAYLLLRRNVEDFGRDYYAFALKQCASWALYPTLASLGAFGWLLAVQYERLGPLALGNFKLVYLGCGLALLLLAAVFWLLVSRSQTPLRHKPSIALGALCLPLALTAFFAFFRLLLQS